MDFVRIIADSSLFAQAILLVLVVLLYFTLWYILRKRLRLREVTALCNRFEEAFWHGMSVSHLQQQAAGGKYGRRGLAAIFVAGNEELKKMRDAERDYSTAAIVDMARRSMLVRMEQEMEYLNQHMQFLATVSGVSPYIGLLGTVWGIITAFRALAASGQATIAQVAPGIAEALIATAMGLLAAIPALIAYNYFSGRIEQLSARFENFIDHYSNILHRNL